MIQPSGIAIKLQSLLKSLKSLHSHKHFYLWLVIIFLGGIVIYQQFMIAALLEQNNLDHDTSDMYSFQSRIVNLEGRSNMHGSMIDNINKDLKTLKLEMATHNWNIKQLQWLHPDLKVTPPSVLDEPPLNFNPNSYKVPNLKRE